jgi:hypothetical protein
VAGAAAVAPDAESALLAVAVRSPLAKLRQESLKARAAVNGDAAHARIHRERSARDFIDAEGAWNFHARGTVDDGARFRVELTARVDARFKANRAVENRESRDAYAFDALIDMATSPTEAAVKPAPRSMAIIRVDHAALVRGTVEGEEVCDLPGLGPIPVRIARDLLGESILKLVITKGVDVMNVTHLGRGATIAQNVALMWTSPECTRSGCTRTFRLENDHRAEWHKTHHTRLDELDRLCDHDHDLKTRHGWALVEGKGKRPMVPPDDPRHPRNHPPPAER